MYLGEVKMTGEMKINALFHRSAFQAMPTPQQGYLLLEIMPVSEKPVDHYRNVNFCLALDRSGSMAGSKLHFMKAAAKKIVDHLGPKDQLSIVIFDDASPAELIHSTSPVTDREVIKKKIDFIQERGGTHMSTGMRLGLSELQQGQNASLVSSMLLLTDGQTWEDKGDCLDIADQCRQAGISIHVLGLGLGVESNWDPCLLEDIAQRSGGEWVAVESAEEIGDVFENVLVCVQRTAVTNTQLTLRLVEGMTPRNIWRVIPMISRLGNQAVSSHDIQVFLGDIQHGAGQSLLVDLLLPTRQPGKFRMIFADIVYDVPDTGLVRQKESLNIFVNYSNDQLQYNQLNQKLMNMIERVVAHKLQTQALDEAAMGEADKATKRLRASATRLLELGEHELAQQANQQAQQLEEGGRIDLASAQKMRYATKRLTENSSLKE